MSEALPSSSGEPLRTSAARNSPMSASGGGGFRRGATCVHLHVRVGKRARHLPLLLPRILLFREASRRSFGVIHVGPRSTRMGVGPIHYRHQTSGGSGPQCARCEALCLPTVSIDNAATEESLGFWRKEQACHLGK